MALSQVRGFWGHRADKAVWIDLLNGLEAHAVLLRYRAPEAGLDAPEFLEVVPIRAMRDGKFRRCGSRFAHRKATMVTDFPSEARGCLQDFGYPVAGDLTEILDAIERAPEGEVDIVYAEGWVYIIGRDGVVGTVTPVPVTA